MYGNGAALSIASGPEGPAKSQPIAHLIGVCGTGMTALARMLLEGGYRVRGSDLRADPPTGPELASWGVEIRLGYDAAHLDDPTADIVVVGNAVTRDNVESVAAHARGLTTLSMPALVDRLIAPQRQRLVVAGTHGKSTTTGVTAWLLEQAGRAPGWLIGATPGFGHAGRLGSGPIVMEGDEYNAAWFDRRAKFFHYRPHVLALTNVEFDHADLYPDLGKIEAAFRELVAGLPQGGAAVLAPDAARFAADVPAGVETVLLGPERLELQDSGPAGVRFRLDGDSYAFPLPGWHGAVDAALAVSLALRAGADRAAIARALAAYPGLRLRQEVLRDEASLKIVRDFGHHPTEIRVTSAGLRDAHPGAELWTVFEPRSYTSRTARFQHEYPAALAGADRVYVAPVFNPGALKHDALDTARIAADVTAGGRPAFAARDWDELLAALLADLRVASPRRRVLALFSNGTMANLPQRLLAALDATPMGESA